MLGRTAVESFSLLFFSFWRDQVSDLHRNYPENLHKNLSADPHDYLSVNMCLVPCFLVCRA